MRETSLYEYRKWYNIAEFIISAENNILYDNP